MPMLYETSDLRLDTWECMCTELTLIDLDRMEASALATFG